MTERGLRMVLLAYPARFRRRHGADLIGTIMDAAGPGGPSRIELFHLVTAGLRQRFRLPPGRPLTAVAVVLAALIAGGFGAAIVSLVAASAAPPAPAVAGLVGAQVEADDHDGDNTTADLWMAPGVAPATVITRVGGHLRATGWQVFAGPGPDDIEAREGTLWVGVYGITGRTPAVFTQVKRVAGPGYLPAVLAGLVVGALAGWLAAASLAHRIVDSRRAAAAATARAGLLLLSIPAAFLYIALAVLLWFDFPGNEVRSLFWVWDSALGVLPRTFGETLVNLSIAGTLLLVASATLTRRSAAKRGRSIAG